ncbi:MAG: hypothetical protein V3T57_00825 [Kiloniellales bacterium]
MASQIADRPGLVDPDEPGVTDNVCQNDCRDFPLFLRHVRQPVIPNLQRKLRRKSKLGNFVFWHMADLQRPAELGPFMATLPTFGAECLLIAAFQT